MKDIFFTIASFTSSAEAQVVKGRLESEGIAIFLRDGHTVNTDPLISNAIGGVKLNVFERDREKAQEILDSINRYSLDDCGGELLCPRCKSYRVQLFTTVRDMKSLTFFLFSFLINALPIYTRYEYSCESCNYKFDPH